MHTNTNQAGFNTWGRGVMGLCGHRLLPLNYSLGITKGHMMGPTWDPTSQNVQRLKVELEYRPLSWS